MSGVPFSAAAAGFVDEVLPDAQGEGALGMLHAHRWEDVVVQILTHIPRFIERVFGGTCLLGCRVHDSALEKEKRSACTVGDLSFSLDKWTSILGRSYQRRYPLSQRRAEAKKTERLRALRLAKEAAGSVAAEKQCGK
jgi:hypothetical protein